MNNKKIMLKIVQLGLVITSVGLFSSVSQAKEYYKWVDSKGTTHYTTTPPPKSAKKRGKVDTYGYRQPTPATQQAATPPVEPQASPTQDTSVPSPPAMDAQQREANAALQNGAQQRLDVQ